MEKKFNINHKGITNFKDDIIVGQVLMVDLKEQVGSVQSGIRPFIIIQNQMGNKHAPTTIGVSLTKASNNKHVIPTHLSLKKSDYRFLEHDSVVLGEQIATISKSQILYSLGYLDEETMKEVYRRILISIGLNNLLEFCV